MTISDWINLIAAILIGGGTLALAFMTWKSIRQTRSIQKSEKRERLLNEIIEWAVDLVKGTYGQDINIISLKDRELISAFLFGFTQLESRSEYIKIASKFDKTLSEVVDEAIKTLEVCIKTHIDWLNCPAKDKDKKMKESIDKQIDVTTKAIKVIEEATKIKTKGISQ